MTKWLHTVETRQLQGSEPDNSEKQIIDKVRTLLAEEDDSAITGPSLAAELSRAWSFYYDDVWVWGVTPRMAQMLRQLADHYEAVHGVG